MSQDTLIKSVISDNSILVSDVGVKEEEQVSEPSSNLPHNEPTLELLEEEPIKIKKEDESIESASTEDKPCDKKLVFLCHLCPSDNPKTFIDHSSLKKHLRIIHNSAKDVYHLNTIIHCSLCFKEFPNKQDYTNHIKIVHPDYMAVNNLQYHQQTLSTTSTSSGASGSASTLKILKTRRKRSKPDEEELRTRFHSKLCSHESFDKFTHATHIAVHDDEDPSRLRCDVCSMQFFGRQALRNHLRWEHSRQFLCDVCSNSFVTKSLFEKHSWKKGNERNPSESEFLCQICEEDCESQCLFSVHTDGHLKDLRVQQLQQ